MHDGADNPAFPCCPCNGLLDLHQRRGNVRGPQFSGLPFYLSVWFSSASVEDGGSAIAISEVFLSHIQYIGSGSEHCVKPCKQKTKKTKTKTQRSGPLIMTAVMLQQLQPTHGEVKGDYCHGTKRETNWKQTSQMTQLLKI